ncbi:hypothetical protein [Paraflavitalea speifideaquila]|uniref:hypothetical protein n=1 Tax=Paraflavitalea speifideaquila TaxID=3076558 RepID=UPI003312FAF4
MNDAGIESPNLADTDILGMSNPSAIIANMQAYNKYYRFFGSFGFKYNITQSLSASTMMGVVHDKVRENFFVPRKGVADDTLTNAIADSRMGTQVKGFSPFTMIPGWNTTNISTRHISSLPTWVCATSTIMPSRILHWDSMRLLMTW